MGTLYGLDYFERVEYRVQRGKLGNTLVINAREAQRHRLPASGAEPFR